MNNTSAKNTAAVCGLFCEACRIYIATKYDHERLKKISEEKNILVEDLTCQGCRSGKVISLCQDCHMAKCAASRKIDFCGECEDYPCEELKFFQSRPGRIHRLELWEALDQIKQKGYLEWIKNMRRHYSCPKCQTLNSAYDLSCWKCGETPSCNYVAKHHKAIEKIIKNN